MYKQRRALITHQHHTFPVRLSQSIIDFTSVLIVQYLIAILLLRRLSQPQVSSLFVTLQWPQPKNASVLHAIAWLPPTIPGTFAARGKQGLVLPETLTWCPQSKKASGAHTKDVISYTLSLSGYPKP